ncbi:MAG: hypothetical protein FJ267_10405, partial [Planctomycetes bacterium]|nr:hypothetical protein [Planctomycetota bacterium]
ELAEQLVHHQRGTDSNEEAMAEVSSRTIKEVDLTSLSISREALADSRTWTPTRLSTALAAAQQAGLIRVDATNCFRLTQQGARRARQAARNHRLWELYLIHFAEVAPSRVDREADLIEHVLAPEMIEQLELLLEEQTAVIHVPENPHTSNPR